MILSISVAVLKGRPAGARLAIRVSAYEAGRVCRRSLAGSAVSGLLIRWDWDYLCSHGDFLCKTAREDLICAKPSTFEVVHAARRVQPNNGVFRAVLLSLLLSRKLRLCEGGQRRCDKVRGDETCEPYVVHGVSPAIPEAAYRIAWK
jgi:hypothetical protein